MKFLLPGPEQEADARDYIQEFWEHGSEINGTGGLDRYLENATYGEWLLKLRADVDIANIPEGRVPAWTYFYVREADGKIVGMVNIRSALNDFLREEGGHIGYSVRPTERRKGYATAMLRDTLGFCGAIGLRDVLITCDKGNLASARVIRSCGGVLKDERFSEIYREIVQRYWIKLT